MTPLSLLHRQLFERVLEAEPEHAEALGGLAGLHFTAFRNPDKCGPRPLLRSRTAALPHCRTRTRSRSRAAAGRRSCTGARWRSMAAMPTCWHAHTLPCTNSQHSHTGLQGNFADMLSEVRGGADEAEAMYRKVSGRCMHGPPRAMVTTSLL